MPSFTTPVFTDNVIVIPSTLLARAATPPTVRGTIDLTGKYSARLFLYIGRTGVTALASPIDVLIRPTIGSDAIRYPEPARRRSSTVAPTSTTISGSTAVGATTLVLTAGTGFAADDIVCIEPGLATEEWARISRVVTNTIYFDSALKQAHASGGVFINKADVWREHLPGGAMYEVVFDFGAAATGSDVRVLALAQTYDKDQT